MAKLSEKYEALVVLNTKHSEEEIAAQIEKISALITDNGAAIVSVDEWGKRRLAYEIEDETEGYYVLFNFDGPTAVPAELERVLGITDGVLRSLVTLRVCEFKPAAPKAAEPKAEVVEEAPAAEEAPAEAAENE